MTSEDQVADGPESLEMLDSNANDFDNNAVDVSATTKLDSATATTVHRYHELERQFGIDAYASCHEGFAAVVKARYSDFLVHEVDDKGNISKLTDMSYEKDENGVDGTKNNQNGSETCEDNNDRVKKKLRTADDGEGTDKQKEGIGNNLTDEKECPKIESIADDSADDLISKELDGVLPGLSNLAGEVDAKNAVELLKYWSSRTDETKKEETSETRDKNITFSVISDKQKRKELHMLIRGPVLSKYAVADTTNDKRVRLWHKQFEKEMPNYGAFTPTNGRDSNGRGNRNNNKNNNNKRNNKNDKRKRQPWPMGRPNFLQFVLYKENVDTITACKDICRAAYLPPKGKGSVTYAGMKDKRGVTSQFCTIYRRTAAEIAVLNNRTTPNKASFHPQNRNQGTGPGGSGGGGNTTSGAIDIVRVGNFKYVDRECNLGTLGGNRFDIVLRNIDPGFSSDDVTCSTTTADGKAESQKQNHLQNAKQLAQKAAAAMEESGFVNYFGMQRFGKYLDNHLVGIEMLKNNFEKAVDIIMNVKPDEQARSTKARTLWKERFSGMDDETKDDKSKRQEAEQSCANKVKHDLARFMTSEQRLMDHLSRRPLDYRGAMLSLPTGMMLMFLHALQSYLWNKTVSHRIEQGLNLMVGDLVLVEDKALEDGGSGTSGLKGKEVAVVTEEDVKSDKYDITDVVIPLPGRKIKYPENESGSFMLKLIEDLGLSTNSFKHQCKEMTLGGDYRKILCRPKDFDYEIIRYKDSLQPLVATDLMMCNGETLKTNDAVDNDDDGNLLLGMVVGFTLPPSSYATIALRELTRRPTAGEYQKELKLEGPCERGISLTTTATKKE